MVQTIKSIENEKVSYDFYRISVSSGNCAGTANYRCGKDPQGKGLDKTTVSLLKAKDSSVVKLVVTSDKGRYTVLLRKPAVIWSVLHMWVFKQRIHSLLNCRVQVLPFPILRFPRQKEI